jgi:hypothetical protein
VYSLSSSSPCLQATLADSFLADLEELSDNEAQLSVSA